MKESEIFEKFIHDYCRIKARSNFEKAIRNPLLLIATFIFSSVWIAQLVRYLFITKNDEFGAIIMIGCPIVIFYIFYRASSFTLSQIKYVNSRNNGNVEYKVDDDFLELLANSHNVSDKFKRIFAQELVASNCVTWAFVLKVLKDAKLHDDRVEESKKPGAEKLKEYADK